MKSSTQAKRLLALDAFRGLTIAFMILVNTPGSWAHVFPPLRHAAWHGATPTDMVFPFFLFIAGVSMFFSFSRFGRRLDSTAARRILKRSLVIFLIGLLLNWFPFYDKPIENLRILGVLQRIALAYGLAAFICLSVSARGLWRAGLGMLLAYWGLMLAMGGSEPFSLEGNFARVIDLFVFGASHMYQGFGIPFDPEGLLSTIPAAVTVMLGYWVGGQAYSSGDKNILVKNLLAAGVLSILLALVWDIYFPINKPLWTSAYVLYTAGMAAVVLALFIEWIDLRGHQAWTKPLVIFGMNPLVIYVLSIVIVKVFFMVRWAETANVYSWLFSDVFLALMPAAPQLASLLFALFIVSLCWAFGWLLYKKNIFIKV